MKILDAGHDYLLNHLDGDGQQTLTFVKREGSNFPFNRGTHEGTNIQEVLRALIDRTDYLNRQKPCAETEAASGLLQAALLLFELRAARRHGRQLDFQSMRALLCENTCVQCGHVDCTGKHSE